MTVGRRRVYIAAVYVEPDNKDEYNTLPKFEHFLQATDNYPKIAGGDFNAWHSIWGSKSINKRGSELMEVLQASELYVCNLGNTPTFETITHGRATSSIIDLTVASGSIYDCVRDWKVNLTACPSSQHNALDYVLDLGNDRLRAISNTSTFKYKTSKANWACFKEQLHIYIANSDILDININSANSSDIEIMIAKITDAIHKACCDSMPGKGRGQFAPKPPWWTERLETLKREVIALHRNLHAAKRCGLPLEHILQKQQDAKGEYARELKAESTKHFREFCELQTKENVWSLTNRLLKEASPRQPPSTLRTETGFTSDAMNTATALLEHFYPDDTTDSEPRHHTLRANNNIYPNTPDDAPFTSDEVLEVLKRMNPKKAPGMDGLSADICLQTTLNYPELITSILNRCLALQYFPQPWKEAYVKVIPKPGKDDYSSLGAFRPIGLLPVFGKLLEKLFIKRVMHKAASSGKVNEKQFGFREQHNTTEAINVALNVVRSAKANKHLVVAVSLDIKAAFDSAWWPALFHRLRHIDCPRNIFGLILSYVQDRKIILDHAGERVTKTMTKGCIQGSTCGPVLWNIILDELLEQPLPPGCHIQAYADDVFLVASASTVQNLEQLINRALTDIVTWGKSVKLVFGPSKTQAIAFTPKAREAKIIMNNTQLTFSREIKLLGVILDEKLLFNSHVRHVLKKATAIFNKLCLYCRPTWGTHPENVSTIYKQVVEPIITYAAGIWGGASEKRWVKNALLSMQRGFALKAIRAFKTVSTPAALALAQFVPLDLKVQEVHCLELAKLSGVTNFLPDDVNWEKPTPVHELPHPAERIGIKYNTACSQKELDNSCDPNTMKIFTDGSKQEDGSVGAAFVCLEPHTNKLTVTKKFKLHNCCSVFQAELLAIRKACQWAFDQKLEQVAILTDSMASLKALEDRSNSHPLVAQIHSIVRQYQLVGMLNFYWVRSHVGIVGNEAADSAANSATSLHRSPDYCLFPLSHVKQNIRSSSLKTWEQRYQSAEQGAHTRRLLPTLKDIKEFKNCTKTSFFLTQFLTGHGYNKSYLHRFKIIDTESCPCDNNSAQTMAHLLEDCAAFSIQRNNHEILCDFNKIHPYKLNEIIKKETTTNSFVNLIEAILSKLKKFNGT